MSWTTEERRKYLRNWRKRNTERTALYHYNRRRRCVIFGIKCYWNMLERIGHAQMPLARP